jgi:hypothetical protein
VHQVRRTRKETTAHGQEEKREADGEEAAAKWNKDISIDKLLL